MGQGYSIPLGADTTKFDAVVDKSLAKVKQLEMAMQNITMRGGGSGGGSGVGSNSGGANPWDRASRAINRYGPYATPGQEKSAMLERVRAQRAVDRAEKELNPQSDSMRTMMMRTRLKIGNFHPLIGDLVKNGLIDESKIDGFLARMGSNPAVMSSILKLAGGAGIAIGAGVAAFEGGKYLVNNFIDRQRNFANAYYSGGGNAGQASALGGFMGMDPSQTAGKANEFGDRLRAGGYGASVMRSAGVIDLGRFTLNKFDNFIKAVDVLRNMSERQAIMVARDMGMSDALWMRDLSPGAYAQLKHSRDWQDSPTARANAAQINATKERLGSWWDRAMNVAGGRVAKDLGEENWGTALWNYSLPGMIKNGVDDMIDMFGGSSKGKSTQSSKTSELTDALNNLMRTMKDHGETLGGGGRTRGSMPPGQKGSQLEESLRSQAQIYGAFTVA